MARKLLKQVRIAAPCHASWEAMKGDDRVRFCGQCQLNVYNISEMTAKEATDLIKSNEGRLCVRMYQRPDGTVLSKNCPVGLMAMRKRLAYSIACVSALMFSAFGMAMGKVRQTYDPQESIVDQSRSWPVVGNVVNWLAPHPTSVVTGKLPVVMGDVWLTPSTKTPVSGPPPHKSKP